MLHEVLTGVWLTANILTAVAYLLIPWEMIRLARKVRGTGASYIFWLFIAFIVFCGNHHWLMPVLGHLKHMHDMALWQVGIQAANDSAMAVASWIAHGVLRRYHGRIAIALGAAVR